MKASKKRATVCRFLSVRLENWCNFASVDVDLSKRVFLVGPNASGKSNFLDVFRFLHDIVLSGGFQQVNRIHTKPIREVLRFIKVYTKGFSYEKPGYRHPSQFRPGIAGV